MIRTALYTLAVATLAVSALPGCERTPADDSPEQARHSNPVDEPAAAEAVPDEPAEVPRQFCAWRIVDVAGGGETVALAGEATRDAQGKLTGVAVSTPGDQDAKPAALARKFTLGPYTEDAVQMQRILEGEGADDAEETSIAGSIRTVPGHNLAWVEEEQPGEAGTVQRGYFVYSATPAHTLVEGLSVLLGPTTQAVREASTFTYDAKGRVLEVVARDGSAKTTIGYRDDGGFDEVVREQAGTVRRTSHIYDDHGRLSEVRTDADADGQPDRIVRFQYAC